MEVKEKQPKGHDTDRLVALLPTGMEQLLTEYEREIPGFGHFMADLLPNTWAVRKRQGQQKN